MEAKESGDVARLGTAMVLADRLKCAMAVGSPLEIAIVVGCAAEMSIFPMDSVLEDCVATLRTTNQPALCGMVWAVRHRRTRAGSRARFLPL
ncbi:hypothetical protein CYJ10_32200 [Cupriavidus pauculus]|uniref:Uncharacterized protein n=1 Tax=Cupriavidus pauculus TaxID=82633 RepID=A0A2N5C2L7_9BURK|nr:hypothetical protein CYJ10_32200 [Cupriavidus pauculus]